MRFVVCCVVLSPGLVKAWRRLSVEWCSLPYDAFELRLKLPPQRQLNDIFQPAFVLFMIPFIPDSVVTLLYSLCVFGFNSVSSTTGFCRRLYIGVKGLPLSLIDFIVPRHDRSGNTK